MVYGPTKNVQTVHLEYIQKTYTRYNESVFLLFIFAQKFVCFIVNFTLSNNRETIYLAHKNGNGNDEEQLRMI